jgi:hypothetical protein
LGLHRRLTLLLSVIVNEKSLKEDKDIRQLLTMLAVITEPINIDVYFDPNNGGFTRKYSKYLEELQKLTPASQAIAVTRKGSKPNIVSHGRHAGLDCQSSLQQRLPISLQYLTH